MLSVGTTAHREWMQIFWVKNPGFYGILAGHSLHVFAW